MSNKPKKKLEKLKSKKIKREPIKESYTEEEVEELKHKYNDIMLHLSNFLSDHNVYEAVPENVKILVFNSELSFYEMIKVFIFEDIYCGLIYDPKLNNYLGLITTRDLMILYQYIIDNFPSEKITDFNNYLKVIFSKNKLEEKNEKNTDNVNDNNINNDINIFEYLSSINYLDYLVYVKKIEFQNIHILSVSLDDNLLETLQKINIKNIHRLLVEEDTKRHHLEIEMKKESKEIEKKEDNKKKENSENSKHKKRNSNTEKTITTNYSDEENKNNIMLRKKDIKKMEEINEESKEIIIEEKSKEKVKEENQNEEIKEVKHVKKKVVKKKKKVENENKEEMNHNENNDDDNKSKDEVKPKKKKVIKKKEIKKDETLETLNINEIENNKEEANHKKKKIIKKKKKQNGENIETIEIKDTTNDMPEYRTDDDLSPKTKKLIKKKKDTIKKATTDLEIETLKKKEEKNEEVSKKNEEKKIIKKKIIKKKIIKKKKKDVSENNIDIDEIKARTERSETVHEKIKHNINDETITESEDPNNIKSTTEATEETMDKKEKYDLPKIKMKRRSVKNKKTEEIMKEYEIKKDNNEENKNNETITEITKDDNKEENIEKKEEILDNINLKDNKENANENKEEKKDIIEKSIDESQSIINNNDITNNENNNEINNENTKKDIDIITETLLNTNLEEMKNYTGIVTNETIFEYLVFNYYSNEMKEFNISLNEMLILGDIPILKKLTNGKDMKEKVYHTFNNYLYTHSDIIPIFNDKEIEGFIYPKDFLYYIYNCESKQSLTNEEFLIDLYKDIDVEKPYGKNRIIYMELNDKNKAFYLKELIEKLDCSIEKKIIIYDPTDNTNLYLISLKTIFRAIVEFQLNNNK